MNKRVSIIIPNWNGKNFLADCLNSLREVEYDNFDIIVVDNGSSDDSVPFLLENYPEVIVVKNVHNLGFASACNRGATKAFELGAEAVLLLNNDTVVAIDFLEEMVKVLRNEEVGIVGSKIYYESEPDKIWFAGGKYIWWRASGQHNFWMKKDQASLAGVMDSDFITGCSMLIRKKVFEDIGFFYEPYFLTVEDLDFSILAKKFGWKIKVALDAKIWHKVSNSREGEFSFSNGYYGTRNRLYFSFRRTKNIIGGLFLLFVVIPVRIIQWSIQGKTQMLRGLICGTIDFCLNRLGKKQ